ncbi:MAG: SAM-dependent methyltransferase [Candidatus Aenigmarchaeota archaeon ex4484_56]|nr:MAG: SAM-dependent methyltransferase [Candidatus Aenigmarchaeota archaeon ex4484_56]
MSEKKVRSFDIVGDIAIVKFPENFSMAEKIELGKKILEKHKNIKSVFEKIEEVSGTFRIAKHKFLTGINNTETIHKEYGCLYKLDINKVYFNFRLGNERLRVAEQVKDGEKVLVMFAGIGCYAIMISKHSNPKIVVSVELNPDAFSYMKENIKLNKIENIIPVFGDVREKIPEIVNLYGKFDRIVMPLPKEAYSFLNCAELAAKKNTIIHYYTFAKTEKECIKNIDREVKILNIVRCGEYAPFVYRYCVDFKL